MKTLKNTLKDIGQLFLYGVTILVIFFLSNLTGLEHQVKEKEEIKKEKSVLKDTVDSLKEISRNLFRNTND
jgi:hypothetical protein